MKILIIGGNGTIGKKVSAHFSKKHEIIIGGRNSGDITVDIADCKSIEAMFDSVGNVDAVVINMFRLPNLLTGHSVMCNSLKLLQT